MFPFQLKVVSIPVKFNFRQIKNREIASRKVKRVETLIKKSASQTLINSLNVL